MVSLLYKSDEGAKPMLIRRYIRICKHSNLLLPAAILVAELSIMQKKKYVRTDIIIIRLT